MADETQTPVVPPVVVVPPPAPATNAASEELARLRLELETYRGRDSAAEQAKRAALDAAAAEKLSVTEARATKLETAAKRQAALNALAGIKRADTFLPLVLGLVALDDNGALTEESTKALAAWRTANPELFDAGTIPGPHPQGGPRTAATPGLDSPIVVSALERLGIPTDMASVQKLPNFAEAQRILRRK